MFAVLVGAFTMFEVLGRSDRRFDTDRLKKIHRVNGIIFFILFLVLAGFGMIYIARTGAELSPRAVFHVMLAHALLFFFLLKLAIIKVYRQFYGKVVTIGIVIVFLSLGTVALSTGYYLLSGRLAGTGGTEISGVRDGTSTAARPLTKTDSVNISKGKEIYGSKCLFCHATDSDKATGNPGMKGIMKRRALPSSGRPATGENIALQLRQPYGSMPAFPGLTEEEVRNLIAYMKTL